MEHLSQPAVEMGSVELVVTGEYMNTLLSSSFCLHPHQTRTNFRFSTSISTFHLSGILYFHLITKTINMRASSILVFLAAALSAQAIAIPKAQDLGSVVGSTLGSITGNGNGNSAKGNGMSPKNWFYWESRIDS